MSVSRHSNYLANLPEAWGQAPIGEIGEVCAGGTPSRANPSYWNGSIPWVTPSELTDIPTKEIVGTREKITEAGLADSSATLLPAGSLIVTTRATIGNVAVAGMPMCTNQGFKNVVLGGRVDVSFYYHLLKFISREFIRLASGTTFLELSARDFSSVVVPVPPLPEQRRIAEILDAADEAIRQTERVIAKLKAVKAGLLHDLLTRGLDERGHLRDPHARPEQFKDSPLGRIPKEWNVRALRDLVESAVDGPFGSNLKTEHYISSPGVRVVRLQNIGTGFFSDTDKAYVSDAHARTLWRHAVVSGDLLIASLGDDNHPIGRACQYPPDIIPGIVKADCFRFRLKCHLAVNAYVMYVLNCPLTRGDINALGHGVTRDRVTLTTVQQIRTRVPPVAEQTRIVSILDTHDTRIRAEEATLAKLRQVKRGLMDDLLTGRVRVSP